MVCITVHVLVSGGVYNRAYLVVCTTVALVLYITRYVWVSVVVCIVRYDLVALVL